MYSRHLFSRGMKNCWDHLSGLALLKKNATSTEPFYSRLTEMQYSKRKSIKSETGQCPNPPKVPTGFHTLNILKSNFYSETPSKRANDTTILLPIRKTLTRHPRIPQTETVKTPQQHPSVWKPYWKRKFQINKNHLKKNVKTADANNPPLQVQNIRNNNLQWNSENSLQIQFIRKKMETQENDKPYKYKLQKMLKNTRP